METSRCPRAAAPRRMDLSTAPRGSGPFVDGQLRIDWLDAVGAQMFIEHGGIGLCHVDGRGHVFLVPERVTVPHGVVALGVHRIMCDRLRVHAHPKVLGAHLGTNSVKPVNAELTVNEDSGEVEVTPAANGSGADPTEAAEAAVAAIEDRECANPRRHKQHDHGEHDPRPDMMPFARRREAALEHKEERLHIAQ